MDLGGSLHYRRVFLAVMGSHRCQGSCGCTAPFTLQFYSSVPHTVTPMDPAVNAPLQVACSRLPAVGER